MFSSPIAYAVVTVFLILLGYTFTTFLFLNKVATLLHVFFQTSALFLLLVPVLTMRLVAEERKQGTLEVLLTSPVTEVAIVMAKFVAALTLVVAMIALTATYAVVIGLYGTPDWGPIYGGYLGLLLLGATLVALGLLVSSLTANQLVAAVVSLGVFLLLWMLDTISNLVPDPLDTLFVNLSLLAHFTPLATGSLFVSDVGFFLSLTLAALFLSVRALARR
jgi:gliding motility-associated transport system permease protein